MIAYLDANISVTSLIWLFLAAFMLHDFEEIIRIEPWFRKHSERIFRAVPSRFQREARSFAGITSSQFAAAVCIEFIVFVPVTFLAAEKSFYLPFLGFNLILLLHVFMYFGQSIVVRMPVPGVLTAIGITFPYSIYLIYRLLHEDLIRLEDLWKSIPFELLLVPIVWIGHTVGQKLIPASEITGRKER